MIRVAIGESGKRKQPHHIDGLHDKTYRAMTGKASRGVLIRVLPVRLSHFLAPQETPHKSEGGIH